MIKFITDKLNLILLAIGLAAIYYLFGEYSNFSFNPTVFYLSLAIFVFNLIISAITFSRLKLSGYFLLFCADLILILNIFLIIGLTK